LLARGGRGRDERAAEHFRRALELDANVWEAQYNLGVIHRRGGELREAIERFEAARAIQPASGDVLVALAEARYSLGERDQAASVLTDYVGAHPNRPGQSMTGSLQHMSQDPQARPFGIVASPHEGRGGRTPRPPPIGT
jgi:tetratricopeptide (TPR) repeat protein